MSYINLHNFCIMFDFLKKNVTMNDSVEKIDIVSLNCRGLRNKLKRKSLFSWLNKYPRVILLQETHSDQSIEHLWSQEFNGDIYFSHGTNNSNNHY